ncbi:PBSX family phage terminase large subunit [Geobacillus stearothermophilus]|uniref:PBSX family phage terminase large subunit n=1 Tax=Geobacillus stearothermophilus TaxID=1422 RepID=UPI0012D2B8F5|nr:PBSX family phage terminase large subunit [Geobacillus stearothermophilus]MED4333337.1 PBSX family phage terminase large subunit [Geobacillus stearothermophilus]MED4995870.1 PBSX family phage terminase large subunit [Geobacillus stearothermophilus]
MKQIRLSEVFTPTFQKVWALAKQQRYLRYVLKGGRASAKSTHIAMMVLLLVMRYPVTALVVRRVGNTLADSVLEQLKEAMEILGVTEYFQITVNPMRITYLPRGNRILFRGADDPQKIKSIKASKFPLAIMWIEELAEFKTEEEVSVIEKSVLRGELPDGLRYTFFYSYNPPKRRQSWVNQKYETQFIPENTFVHHSTYLDNPFLSKDFIEEAEHTKRTNEMKYRHEYLGEPIGSGVVPFDNLVFRTITDEEIKQFDNIRQGIDWGYGVDPFAFVRWHYDKTRRTIYAIDEIYGVKLSNREVAEKIKAKNYHVEPIIADSAEPKSVDEMKKEHGIPRIKGAKKGPGSVEYGEKWLDDLEAIVIDPKRTPNIAREFESIDYQVDADGNPKPKLEDKNNHTIDATRYAFEDDMKRPSVSILK